MSDSELQPEDSIIATRERRANAGSRLRSLLEAEEPLEDEDNIFLEFEDDVDYEDIKEQEGDEEEQDEEEEEQEEQEGEGEGEVEQEVEEIISASRKRKLDEDDENFSSDSGSEDENEAEEEDVGEKELQNEQREQHRREEQRKKQKMFEIKIKPTATEPKKKKKFVPRQTAEQLLSGVRRVSQRAAAVKNTHDVIQRLQESEARRAAFAVKMSKHPNYQAKEKVRKLTQEERLAEAKITEAKNIASLNKYFEQEEERKQRQRAAMLARRVPMTHVIRYFSTTKLVPPRIIFQRPPIKDIASSFNATTSTSATNEENIKQEVNENEGESIAKPEGGEPNIPQQDGTLESKMDGAVVEAKSVEENIGVIEVVQDSKNIEHISETKSEHLMDIDPAEMEVKNENESNENRANNEVQENGVEERDGKQAHGDLAVEDFRPEEAEARQADETKLETAAQPNGEDKSTLEQETKLEKLDEESEARPEEATKTADMKADGEIKVENETRSDGKVELGNETKLEGDGMNGTVQSAMDKENLSPSKSIIKEESEKNEKKLIKPPKVEGPHLLRLRNTVSLLNFPDEIDYTKIRVKSTLLGSQAIRHPPPLLKPSSLVCAITGRPAKFRDPSSGLPYLNIEAYKMIKLVKEGMLTWNNDMGGAYIGLRNQRHATGVPPGF